MNRPVLTALQMAWLEELGLDRRMMAHFATADSPFVAPVPAHGSSNVPTTAAVVTDSDTAAGRAAARDAVQLESRAGEDRKAPPSTPIEAPSAEVIAALKGGVAAPRPRPTVQQSAASRTESHGPIPQDWEGLVQYMADCAGCDLRAMRGHVVVGSGKYPEPAWLVVGEAPGNRDDREGKPFQGKAGTLLHAMLASIGVDGQADVYYTNIVKCRPLGNRPPSAQEIASCKPFLDRQISLLRPARILTLGTLAAQTLLGTQQVLDGLRGRVHAVRDESGREIPLVATYHPAALLLRPQHKPQAWQDLNLALSLMHAR